ncbi:hypothetical protein [Kribbella sp. NPDC049227]|uniref:hypothetical protein n=1 Tax=Kribbella sp. NPDC049227 TaxID=3364113 RepID=UPI0037236D2A
MALWGPIRPIMVGGLLAVGFLDEHRVIVGSHDGLGVFEAISGVRLDRVRDPDGDYGWYRESPPSAVYADADGEHRVPVAGLWGGDLPNTTKDGWTYRRVLTGAGLVGPDGTEIAIADDEEFRACGFSPEGHVFVFATSPNLYLAARSMPDLR